MVFYEEGFPAEATRVCGLRLQPESLQALWEKARHARARASRPAPRSRDIPRGALRFPGPVPRGGRPMRAWRGVTRARGWPRSSSSRVTSLEVRFDFQGPFLGEGAPFVFQ